MSKNKQTELAYKLLQMFEENSICPPIDYHEVEELSPEELASAIATMQEELEL